MTSDPRRSLVDGEAAALAAVFTHHAGSVASHGEVGEIVDLLVTGSLDRASFDEIASRVGANRRDGFRGELLDLVLFALAAFLRDHAMTSIEANALRELGMLFRLGDGELSRHRAAALSVTLGSEMQRLAADGIVDWTEESYLAAIQSALRLGYDEFLDLACAELTEPQRRALRLP